ncbi:tubulin-specific chaperone-like protein E [Lophium mytilinum]|uniref:Tubulin-specific chaperone-like protein E n=1 Tax=Lophium mytilinum TaxID=390894 RepID=A0A6A6QYA8_9PEZI|nr:tubulin-specific chaperone-like protein E [Lophium mytilinum]
MNSQFYVGKRVSFNRQLCTVRYYGEVSGTKGDWLGVEWDDPTRGKHNGENGGVRYFNCLNKHPTAGSFVRPTRVSEPPRSFVEALRHKYASEDFEDSDTEIVYVRTDKLKKAPARDKPIKISGKEVEEVGFDKIRKQLADLNELKIVLLDGLRMSRPVASLKERLEATGEATWPEALTDIRETCPKIIELDLSRNLFEEWREVASICEQLDKLKSLRVDGNRFRDISLTETDQARCISAFKNIKALKLEDTFLSWRDITRLASLFPDLTSFVGSSNSFGTLSLDLLPNHITELTLEDNVFHMLTDLAPLASLPNLQRLLLKDNRISDIASPGSEILKFSPTVTDVDLSYNEISTWNFIDQLQDVFPGITALRIAHNPLYQSLQAADGRALSAEDGYMLTIARLGQLQTLNFSPITPKERLNSEMYYLSLIGKELSAAPEAKAEAIIATHRRYAELCEEYGEPSVSRSSSSINPNSLAARLIRFTFHLGTSAKPAVKEGTPASFVAEIPMSFSVYSALGIVGKRFGLPPMKLRLLWETGDWIVAGKDSSLEPDTWDSDSDGGDEGGSGGAEHIRREVELVAGTRVVGTWVDGAEADVRVELR